MRYMNVSLMLLVAILAWASVAVTRRHAVAIAAPGAQAAANVDYTLNCAAQNGTAHTGGTAFLGTLSLPPGVTPSPTYCAAHVAQQQALGAVPASLADAQALRVAQIRASEQVASALGFPYALPSAPSNVIVWRADTGTRADVNALLSLDARGVLTYPIAVPGSLTFSGSGQFQAGDLLALLAAGAQWLLGIAGHADALIEQVYAAQTIDAVIAVVVW